MDFDLCQKLIRFCPKDSHLCETRDQKHRPFKHGKVWQIQSNTCIARCIIYILITCISHENHLWNRILRFALGLGSKLKHTDLHLLDFFPVFPVAKLQLYRRIKRSESSVSSHKVWKGYERFIFGSYLARIWFILTPVLKLWSKPIASSRLHRPCQWPWHPHNINMGKKIDQWPVTRPQGHKVPCS